MKSRLQCCRLPILLITAKTASRHLQDEPNEMDASFSA